MQGCREDARDAKKLHGTQGSGLKSLHLDAEEADFKKHSKLTVLLKFSELTQVDFLKDFSLRKVSKSEP